MGCNALPRDRRVDIWLSRIAPVEAPADAEMLAAAIDLPSLLDLLNRLGRTNEVEQLTVIGRGGTLIAAAPVPTSSQERIEARTKPCTMCGVDIEKDGGCTHMTCGRCRHEFCWRCLQQWSPSHQCPGAPRPEQHPPEFQARVAAVLERYDPNSEDPTAIARPTRLEECARQIVQYAERHLGANCCAEPNSGELVAIRRTVAELEGLWNQRAYIFEALSAFLEAGTGRRLERDFPARGRRPGLRRGAGPVGNPHAETVAVRARGAPAEAGGGDHEAERNAVRARRLQQEERRIVRDMLMAELPTPGPGSGVEAQSLEARDDELLAAIRDLEQADAAVALALRWRQLAPSDGSVLTDEQMHWWRHALVGRALAEESHRLLFLGRRRLCRALGIRLDTEDGGSDPLDNLFVIKASQAVAAFFAELCGEDGDVAGRVERAAEQLRLPQLGSISQELRPLIDIQTRLRHRRQDLAGVVEAATAAGEGEGRENSGISRRWVEEELETPRSRTMTSGSERTESDLSEAVRADLPGPRRDLKRWREDSDAR
jgi:hypothetical protein